VSVHIRHTLNMTVRTNKIVIFNANKRIMNIVFVHGSTTYIDLRLHYTLKRTILTACQHLKLFTYERLSKQIHIQE